VDTLHEATIRPGKAVTQGHQTDVRRSLGAFAQQSGQPQRSRFSSHASTAVSRPTTWSTYSGSAPPRTAAASSIYFGIDDVSGTGSVGGARLGDADAQLTSRRT
jgi:hypothetical protein